MRQKRSNPRLVLLALLLTVFAPQELERVRGVVATGPAPAFNCVHALFPALELEFVNPARPLQGAADPWPRRPARGRNLAAPPQSAAQAVLHPVARGEDLVETAYQACLARTPSFSAPAFQVVSLPNSPISATLPPAEVVGSGIAIRGPPLPHVILLTPSLRAPPAA